MFVVQMRVFSTCPHLQIDLKVPEEEVMDLPKQGFMINFGESPENDEVLENWLRWPWKHSRRT